MAFSLMEMYSLRFCPLFSLSSEALIREIPFSLITDLPNLGIVYFKKEGGGSSLGLEYRSLSPHFNDNNIIIEVDILISSTLSTRNLYR